MGVRSGLLRTQAGIHRAPLATLLHTTGHPSYAGQPYGSLHNILGICSSDGVCACWPCRLGLTLSSSGVALWSLLLPPRTARCDQLNGALTPTEITLESFDRYFFSFSFLFLNPNLYRSPLDSSRTLSKKKERIKRKMGSSSRKTKKRARSLCPLDVKDQRKYFKILLTTTRSETSPDEKKISSCFSGFTVMRI